MTIFEMAVAIRDRIEATQRKSGRDDSRFACIAEEALLGAPWPDHFELDFERIASWIVEPGAVQPNEGGAFSDLPLVLARGNGFFVQLLVWSNGTADIHQHAFSGAFALLSGSSIHCRYRLEIIDRAGAGFAVVDCTMEHAERLAPQQVRRIDAGARLTHSVFHLDEPTVSLVVRTHYEPWAAPQLSVLPPKYAVAPEWLRQDGQLAMLERTLRTMQRIHDPKLGAVLEERLCTLDLGRAILLLRSSYDLALDPEMDRILGRMRAVHGPRADHLPEMLRRTKRMDRIKNLRRVTADPRARFALAALSVAEDRDRARAILRLGNEAESLLSDGELPALRKLWAEL